MNNKLLLQDLTDKLAEAGKLKKKDADEFLRAFFKIAEDGLFEDGILKINGLGTLKLVLVEARKSVNVSTGEEFEIGEHFKVSFIPDADLKNAVNQPYAHLEPVELESGKEIKVATNKVHMPLSEEKPESKRPKKINRSTIMWVLFFVLIAVLGIWSWMSNNQRMRENAAKINEIELIDSLEADATLQQDLAALNEEKDSVGKSTDTPDDSLEAVIKTVANEKGTVAPAAAPIKAKAVTPPKTPTAAPVTGDLATVVLQPGSRLTLLSLKYYGHKAFWVYIYQANKSVIKNPDNVPTGTTIRIPKPDPKIIDAQNPALIAKAKALQLQILGAK
ncbi:MAG TPA: HU family DNA-binding protein [Bacteroidales bacterium]|nr:HU family DNA-binding protein [Bacteroidales bacterium]